MQKTDFKNLDGHLLNLFILISAEGSVSRAAAHLGINQSSASHGLERLRRIVGDPLFVRSGRGIVPTARAEQLLETARSLLSGLEAFAEEETYLPEDDRGAFRIAANDYEVETILRPLLPAIRQHAPHARIHIARAPSRPEWIAMLRANEVDLVLAPRVPGDHSDLAQQALFEDHHVCVYDPQRGPAPKTIETYCGAPHAVMVAGSGHRTEVDSILETLGHRRQIALVSPSFSMLAELVRGTDIVATMPSRLAQSTFSGFATARPPIEIEPFSIAQIWHARDTSSRRHQWLRERVRSELRHSGPD